MDKNLTEDKLYQIIDQLHKRQITPIKFYSIIIHEIHPFYHGNGRTCKILFANDDKMIELINETKSEKTNNII